VGTDSFIFGMPWWLWLVLIVAGMAVAIVARKASARAAHRAANEKLAQAADAAHEGAITRHEGGA
jgi:F0F1-type ATP synthase assembly protein I